MRSNSRRAGSTTGPILKTTGWQGWISKNKEIKKKKLAGLCVIQQRDEDKSSPVALYFPGFSSLSHLVYSCPAPFECYKSQFHCLSWCCRKQKWTFNPLDSTFYYYSFRLNPHPENGNKMGKNTSTAGKKNVKCLSFPLPAAFPWLENVSDVEGNLSSLKVAVLLVQKIYCLKDVLYQFDIMKLGQFNF